MDGKQMENIVETVKQEIGSWAGVEVLPHRFGGWEFRLRNREIGHLHDARQADLLFPKKMREQLVADGLASPHHLLPATGWLTFYIKSEVGIPALIRLFRRSYERIEALPHRVGDAKND